MSDDEEKPVSDDAQGYERSNWEFLPQTHDGRYRRPTQPDPSRLHLLLIPLPLPASSSKKHLNLIDAAFDCLEQGNQVHKDIPDSQMGVRSPKKEA